MLPAFQVQTSLPLSFGRTIEATNSNWSVSEAIRRGNLGKVTVSLRVQSLLKLLMLPVWLEAMAVRNTVVSAEI